LEPLMASLWFAALSAIVAQRMSVVGFEPEERNTAIAIPGSLLAIGLLLLTVGH
jgi:hypothetical protein